MTCAQLYNIDTLTSGFPLAVAETVTLRLAIDRHELGSFHAFIGSCGWHRRRVVGEI